MNSYSMMKKLLFFIYVLALLSSCSLVGKDKQGDNNVVTSVQETMMSNGWELSTPEGGDFDESMGIKPVYGLQDNYFDITIGQGFSVAVKIMSLKEHKCIRYIFVPEGQTVTVNEIPQGKYYLKLAYGNDWMVKTEGNHTLGKFTKNAFYEKSTNVFDFGMKNSTQLVNYKLEINVIDGSAKNNFQTIAINETEFEND